MSIVRKANAMNCLKIIESCELRTFSIKSVNYRRVITTHNVTQWCSLECWYLTLGEEGR